MPPGCRAVLGWAKGLSIVHSGLVGAVPASCPSCSQVLSALKIIDGIVISIGEGKRYKFLYNLFLSRSPRVILRFT